MEGVISWREADFVKQLVLMRSYCVPGLAHLWGSDLGLHGLDPASRSPESLACVHMGLQVMFLEDWSSSRSGRVAQVRLLAYPCLGLPRPRPFTHPL